MRGLGMRGLTPWARARLRRRLLAEWGPWCWLCEWAIDLEAIAGDDLAFSFDHVRTKRDGGGDEYENLRCSHRVCNGARDADPEPIEPPGDWPAPALIRRRGLTASLPQKPRGEGTIRQ